MRNLSLRIKCSLSKTNSAFFCPALFNVVLKNFKRMLLLHRFDGFFCFLNWFFKAFLLNWSKNLREQFRLYQKRAGIRIPWTLPLDVRLIDLFCKSMDWFLYDRDIRHERVKHDKCTKDSVQYFRMFSFNDVNVTLLLLINSDSWSSSMVCVLEQAFFVGRGSGNYIGTWLDDTPGHIEGGSIFSVDFYFFKTWWPV